MNRFKYILLLTIALSAAALSQELYIPLEFQAAYEDGSRSPDGKPGSEYWQNSADYKLSVILDPAAGKITGSGTITYNNNSPDILDRIVIRLYQNLNKAGTLKDFPFNDKEFTDGIVIRSLTLNKRSYDVMSDTSLENTGTNLVIKNLDVLPKKQVTISVSWEFTIPKVNKVRMGQYDSTTFFIAYWYPQIAVYDDIDGWDMNEYTGTTEFYNDFNSYDVNITVPNNFGVWAPGTLEHPETVLSPEVLLRYKEAMISSETVNIISWNDYQQKMVPYDNSGETNVWHFKASGIPDFTFGAAANYLWDGKAAYGGAGNSVFVSAAYNAASLDFYEVCDIAAKTVEMMSKELPGIDFPFPKLTIFNGSGGMESPMMVNEGSSKERIWMVHTTVHEAAHSYFPFGMGINERKYAWMDEGWTQMLSEYIQYEFDKTIDFRARNVKRYLDYSGEFDEVPMMFPSFLIRGEMYGNHAYFRPANAYNILKDFMGDVLFKKALQEFMKRWKGKHPTPYDFFFTFEDAANDDYTWFWQPWFFNSGYPDLAIDTVSAKDGILKIQISKEGALPIPVALTVTFKDGSLKRSYRSAAVWKSADEDDIWIEMETDKKPAVIELGNQYIPDADTTNNLWQSK